MLHASETWPVTKPCLLRLQRNDRAMIRQICNVKPQDTATITSTELLARIGIEDLDLILKERRLRWYGHVERSNGAVTTAFDIQVNGFLVGCFRFSGPLRQYFSLYRAVSQREGERGEKGQRRVKMSRQPPPAPNASAIGPCPTFIRNVGRPGTGSLPRTIAPPDHPTG